jgi:DNA-binding LytR/AlgR family response regulator
MTEPSVDWLARYRRWRAWAEPGFWVVVLSGSVVFNTLVAWIDLRRSDPGFPFWQPAVWELTSTAVVGALLPAVIAFERRFPLRWGLLRAHLPWHLAASAVFCAVHIVLMTALRKAAYAAVALRYDPGPLQAVFAYEYLKDVRTYVNFLLALGVYRFVLLRLQGEARLLDAPEPPAGAPPAEPQPPARPERFLVRKLRKEFLVAAADIEWLQAQGNYIGLHVNGHDYLLRSTLTDFLDQLDPARFTRVHRSYAVNRDRIAEIEPTDGGDAKLRMKDGTVVPCSRRYRELLAPS